MSGKGEVLVCTRCDLELVPKQVVLRYMGLDFNAEIPCCPSCGQPYLAEDIVRGKLKAAEQALEEK